MGDSDVTWPWENNPNWAAPREGATYDPGDEENWRLACDECELHFPKDIEMHVVGAHWQGHFPEWTEDNQEPGIQLQLVWVGLGVPPDSNRRR